MTDKLNEAIAMYGDGKLFNWHTKEILKAARALSRIKESIPDGIFEWNNPDSDFEYAVTRAVKEALQRYQEKPHE